MAAAASTERLLAYALEHFTLVDITIHNTPLEQIIAQIYQSAFDQLRRDKQEAGT